MLLPLSTLNLFSLSLALYLLLFLYFLIPEPTLRSFALLDLGYFRGAFRTSLNRPFPPTVNRITLQATLTWIS